MAVSRTILEQIKRLIPPLDGTLHKGQSGRVGVLGGALDYTGAPFFASFSALRFGADLSHVICSPTAAGAIKSYSPDLIVHPILREDSTIDIVRPELDAILARLHVLVIGPGLGRESYMQRYAKAALAAARARDMYVVVDADGLYMIGQDPDSLRGYPKAVVTPNVVEFGRLLKDVGGDPDTPSNDKAALLSRLLGGVTVLEKGAHDIVAVDNTKVKGVRDGQREQIEVDITGGMKRCGGQGDILSGAVGTFLAWGKCYEDGAFGDGSLPFTRIPLLAAVGGSMVTRTASRRAFAIHGRGVVTQDMLSELAAAFSEVLGEEHVFGDKGKL
ncbi:Ribokinase-like protein [Fistulina hepatica ATCC 64428]|uniref:ATP-dependent (S)-NAD(P)H-hydrate dehydratase n=1 Tax=Fistulina hepatica ATCC 64428 TaxID=1128425 RepID=A0A0D7AKK4_9AGAR|nr:Ribokinase-like protein [Fistulina hepatica ATCC 64428]KIY51831.1 Ribokinase-like protein [Fistulina hepatica ATCC 64428]